MNIALLLEMAADTAPDRIALACDGRRWTYAQLLAAARGAGRVIADSGVDCVGLLDESSAASVIALFGAALAGVPYCPLNYRLADVDLATLAARIAPAVIIGDRGRVTRLDAEGGSIAFSRDDFVAAALAADAAEDAAAAAGDADIAVQLFTSGTTSAPKAAILRHAHLVSYILDTVEFGGADESDAALVSVPPYHVAGIAAVLSSIYAQRCIVMLPAFCPDAWLSLAAEEGVTNAFVVPTMLSRIVEAVEKGCRADPRRLRAIAYGGGKMPQELIVRALDRFPAVDFTNAYGLTETSSTIALLGPEDHRLAQKSSDPRVRGRLASVGRPLPSVEIEIRGEDGQAMPAGQAGEIFVRGPQVSGEYRERSALDADGWFPTRDAGYLDEQGYLFLSGRADDVIVRGGENISPGEIEDVLLTHPAIADAAAVAVPSVEWGEAIGVAIVVRPDCDAPQAEELKRLIRHRLRSSRVPDHVTFMDSLPYNEMGKLLRRELRERMAS
ncbi:AMP-dependent synthetase [Sphingopyxis lindanitolerans]|uniref:AMP-dependent synthetase n=1 Tax=Sphingopyxis lindanitolerans TaxID=2054227 RepID=A0A2S8B5Q9_9SPHN|nr:AMP-binding protein [Sphingopyxis lindanitolerans]PQM27744.1 AMP-dependent synthetase [Sphingopyxis lindanitolerans]